MSAVWTTPWYPADVKPVRKGVYEVKDEIDLFAYWDGARFGYRTAHPRTAFNYRGKSTCLPRFTTWRGLTKP